MGKYNYRRYIKRHLERIVMVLNREGVKLHAIAEQYEHDHPEISQPLWDASYGLVTVIQIVEKVQRMI